MAVEEGRILPIPSHKNARSGFIPLRNSTQAKVSYTPESASHHTGKGKITQGNDVSEEETHQETVVQDATVVWG